MPANSMRSVLTVNSGSSSLKACLFQPGQSRRDFRYEHIGEPPYRNHEQAFDRLLHDLQGHFPDAIGHRFVHGGDIGDAATILDQSELARLEGITHLAPLHLPGNLLGARLCARRFDVPQVACFDTAFHFSMPEQAKRLPLPSELGMRRFGFHGLNYAHLADRLPRLLGESASGRIVACHLGSGASLCLMQNLKSVDTTMGFTPAGGIVMGTRSGDLDPGVMLELAKRFDQAQLSELVYHKMGLFALSGGCSGEMSTLLASPDPQAAFAIEYFCRNVRANIGGLAAKAGGIEALIFTGGIGEHCALIREKICSPLGFLGFELDLRTNEAGLERISSANSKPVLIIPADEERTIRKLTLEIARENPGESDFD